MGFRADLTRSEEAVDVVISYLSRGGRVVEKLSKADQEYGDIRILGVSPFVCCEIKYDLYARRSGNLCFELSNGKKDTGIMSTKANYVYYVVPGDKGKTLYIFEIEKLRHFIQTSPLIVIKNGGDKKKFKLALCSIDNIVKEDICKVVELAAL